MPVLDQHNRLQHKHESETGGRLKIGGGQRAAHAKYTGAPQNVLQTDSPVNGVVLREKKVSRKTKGGLVGRPVSKICKWFIPA